VRSAGVYRYIGPAVLAEGTRPGPDVIIVTSAQVLTQWLADRPVDELGEPFTFVVGFDGRLRLAPQRSEHVDCAGGRQVLAAGEMLFARDGARWSVNEVSNQSTGYCPDPGSWPAVAMALDHIGLARPGDFTHKIVFRRCPPCGQVNIVRDDDFACAVCGSTLPAYWNIGSA
jgi:hypothetical protein